MKNNRVLQPFAGMITALLPLVLLFVVLGSLVQAFRLFDGSVCFDATAGVADVIPGIEPLDGLKVQAHSSVETMNVCLTQPSGAQRAVGALLDAPSSLAYGGALFLLTMLLRHAERDGVHTLMVAKRIAGLGRFLMLVVPLALLVESVAQNLLLAWSTSGEVEEFGFVGDWGLPWWAIITGFGMITLSRVMLEGVAMREDLEGTV